MEEKIKMSSKWDLGISFKADFNNTPEVWNFSIALKSNILKKYIIYNACE